MTQPDDPINASAPPLLPAALKAAADKVLDLLLPPQCLNCGIVVAEIETLCPACWSAVNFITPPHCDVCGLPFPEDFGAGVLCGACHRAPPAFDRARAAMLYDDASRGMVLAFKHGDRTDMAPAFTKWLLPAGGELMAAADFIAPVPLHWTRLFGRRFNQAALIARELSKQGDATFAPDLLQRKRRTPSQAGLGGRGRHRNVRGAFRVAAKWRHRINGRRVLLIDDVMTTGATVSACARALRRGGADYVDVLTLARVVRARHQGE